MIENVNYDDRGDQYEEMVKRVGDKEKIKTVKNGIQ